MKGNQAMMSTLSMGRYQPTLLTLLTVGLAAGIGCSSRSGSAVPIALEPGVADVGSVVVAVSLDSDTRQTFDEVDGTARLKAAVEGAVWKIGKLNASSPRVLEVEVTDFRLRSAAATLWWGMLAGVDILDVHVRVWDGDRVVRSYTTGVGSSGIQAVDRSSFSRLQPMLDTVAERLAEQL